MEYYHVMKLRVNRIGVTKNKKHIYNVNTYTELLDHNPLTSNGCNILLMGTSFPNLMIMD